LFLIYAVPHQDVSLSKLIDALHQELRDIRENGVTQEELDRAKTRIRADLIRSLKSNLGLARKLAKAEAQTGDWRWVFSSLDEFAQVHVQDIKRVARKYLRPANRTAGRMIYQDGPEGDH
jgi:predicted Zn-dependent peptidase